jgi:hypothetical protein
MTENVITYTVGQIPIVIARQIMVKLTQAQILAKLTPSPGDQGLGTRDWESGVEPPVPSTQSPVPNPQFATIEVALFDRPELDRLLEPYEQAMKRKP